MDFLYIIKCRIQTLSPLFSAQFGEDEEVVSEESLYPLGAVAEGFKKKEGFKSGFDFHAKEFE